MLSVGRLDLQFEIDEEKIPEMVEEVFGDDKRQINPTFWIRKSAITIIGEAQIQSKILSPQQIKKMPRA